MKRLLAAVPVLAASALFVGCASPSAGGATEAAGAAGAAGAGVTDVVGAGSAKAGDVAGAAGQPGDVHPAERQRRRAPGEDDLEAESQIGVHGRGGRGWLRARPVSQARAAGASRALAAAPRPD